MDGVRFTKHIHFHILLPFFYLVISIVVYQKSFDDKSMTVASRNKVVVFLGPGSAPEIVLNVLFDDT